MLYGIAGTTTGTGFDVKLPLFEVVMRERRSDKGGEPPRETGDYPGTYAASNPSRRAQIMFPSNRSQTYRELDERSRRFAMALRKAGVEERDHIALVLENRLEFLEVCWAAQQSGLYYTPASPKLRAAELTYILRDCDAQVVVGSSASRALQDVNVTDLPMLRVRIAVDDDLDGFTSYESAVATSEPIDPDQGIEGQSMLYSSGTTGRPKGIIRKIPGHRVGTTTRLVQRIRALYEATEASVFLLAAPLYHAAPLGWGIASQRIGSTLVVMEKFDAEGLLQAVERYRVTHVHCVPTMLVRLLRLPRQTRTKYDLSSLRYVVHAAAPCPIAIKEQLIEWLGPIIYEYYAASEGTGPTVIDSAEWLAHKGSVGRPYECDVHVMGEDGSELGPGEVGQIYFSSPGSFEYYKQPEATSEAFNESGWTTVGDIGYVDEEGYLYLTGRKNFVIISGGVNVYPQEVEGVLLGHPLIADAAVIGKPDEEFGQRVMAVVQLEDGIHGTPALAEQIISYSKQRLAGFKCPSVVVFDPLLPRGENGKLYKNQLLDKYT